MLFRSIYRDWVADDESASERSEDSDDTDDDSSASDDDTETDEPYRSGGLAVPGSGKLGSEEDDDVARSFEAMSLSPDRAAFGGRSEAFSILV